MAVDVGQRFGRLVVLAIERRASRDRRDVAMCRCDCGSIVRPVAKSLWTANTRSCGCLKRERFVLMARLPKTHGDSSHFGRAPEYMSWIGMKKRCYQPTTRSFEHYGGRGITVCDRWRSSYEAFVADMGRKPTPQHTLDRIDVNGNYEPGNCRWATRSEQQRNKRRRR